MRILVVVNNLDDWPLKNIGDIEVLDAKSYIMSGAYSSVRNAKVFNLCRSYRYQTLGYYVSLLATARGHKPQPSLLAIQDIRSPSMIRFISEELDELIQKTLKSIQTKEFTLSIYFGKNISKKYDQLASHLFKEFQAPFLRAEFSRSNEKWNLQNINPIAGSDIPKEHHDFVVERAKEYFTGKKPAVVPKKVSYRYDLAILHDPDEKNAPSCPKALQKIIRAAESMGFSTELVQKEDYRRLAEFDALFIRETTSVNHHTYRFARRAAAHGLVVIDDPESILKCSNKVYLAELLERHGIKTPKTVIVDKDNFDEVEQKLGFPCILKQPDSSFSQGVIKVNTAEEFIQTRAQLLTKSDLLIAQEFLPTQFDWRIGILNQQPLFACKYFMARSHWQIYEHLSSGVSIDGKSETIPISMAPKQVIRAALKAANLIGNGLYGVDLKQIEKECYVIEVNDNPNLDSGVEDLVLQDELYLKIMTYILNQIERKKNASYPKN